MKYICKECKEIIDIENFDIIKKRKKLCLECLKKMNSEKKMEYIKNVSVKAICKNCEEPFDSYVGKKGQLIKIYCSKKCGSEYNSKKKIDKICKYCDTPYIGGIQSKYCSKK